MAIWLRRATAADAPHGVGSETIVLRAADVGAYVELDKAFQIADEAVDRAREQAHVQSQRMRADAHMVGDRILDKARQQAAEIDKEAQARYGTARQRGYQDGQATALAEWLEQSAQTTDMSVRALGKLRERLADLIAEALAQTLTSLDRASLFTRALEHVDSLVDGSNTLKLVVARQDEDAATRAAAVAERRWRASGLRSSIRVVVQPDAVAGHCQCESDLGIVDASLPALIQALQNAIVTVATKMVQP